MKTSNCKSFDELPIFLNARMVADLLGIGMSTVYMLMQQPGFPILKVRTRIIIPKDKLKIWIDENTGEF